MVLGFKNDGVKELNEKTLKIRKKSSGGNSVEEDLKDHFGVLDDLSSKLEEYYTIPTITAGRNWDLSG